MLGAMGMDDQIPKNLLQYFSTDSQKGGSQKAAETFKDSINSYGYGSSFVREYKQIFGLACGDLFKEDAEPKERYIQRQINELSKSVKLHET